MERTKMPQLTDDEMFAIYEDFKASGLSKVKYCREKSHKMSHFNYWEKKYLQKFPPPADEAKPRRGRKPKAAQPVDSQVNAGTIVEALKESAEKKEKPSVIAKTKAKVKAKPKTRTKAKSKAKPKLEPKGKPGPKAKPEATLAEEAVAVAPKRRGRPPRVKTEDASAVKVKRPGRVKKIAEGKQPAGPVIQIRYPNGTRILVSADIDLKRLKDLIQL